jgi:cytochrome o ubiquinol oxidase subunit 2
MSRKYKVIIGGVLLAAIIGLAVVYFRSVNIAVLDPKGTIGQQEKQLIVFALSLSLVVVIPVFGMLFWFAWRYRASNHLNVKYSPNWDHSAVLESIWWLVPSVLIVILSVVTWRSAHQLDPFKSISSSVKPLNIQVIALDWKWLFIYPDQRIATVNYFEFPKQTPVNFQITADAPMNSFWIPQLGGQIYAMPGMSTQLHLMASQSGNFRGSSANISGEGFAGMDFSAHATDTDSFNAWVKSTQQSQRSLDLASYNQLSAPSQKNPKTNYALSDPNLYDIVVMKFMEPIQGLADNTTTASIPEVSQP